MARLTKQQKAEIKEQRMNRLREFGAILATGRCPECKTKLYRNLSLSGWFQCGRLGAEGFQKEPGEHCNFQFFYDPTPEEAAILAKEKQ